VLDGKRDEVDARGSRNGTGCNAPVAMASADHLCDVGSGWCFDRVAEVEDLQALAPEQCCQELLGAGTRRPGDEPRPMFAGSGQRWDGAAFFPTKARNGGPIDNRTARLRLAELETKVREDRMVLNDGHFFDSSGNRIEIEPLIDA
jgi:hypothetical protein